MSDLFNISALLEYVSTHQDFTDGLQQILFGDRKLSLFVLFAIFNLTIIIIYFLSRSFIGIIILFVLSFIVYPIFRIIIFKLLFNFIEFTPFPLEQNISYTKRFNNDEFVAAITAISNQGIIYYPLKLYTSAVMQFYSGIRSLVVVSIIIVIWHLFKFIFGLLFTNLIFALLIYLLRNMYDKFHVVVSN